MAIVLGQDPFAPAVTPARRKPARRAVNPRVATALRALLEARHFDREHAATWETLRRELEATDVFVSCERRLQEAASYLRRVEKVAVGGDSEAGVYIVGDDRERRLIAAERVKRIRAEVKELEAFDRALYARIAASLPIEEEDKADAA